jgi:hypothetical protein
MTVISSNTGGDAFDAAFAAHSATVADGTGLQVDAPFTPPADAEADAAAAAAEAAAGTNADGTPVVAPALVPPAAGAPDAEAAAAAAAAAAEAAAAAGDPPAPAPADPALAEQFKQFLATIADAAKPELAAAAPAPAPAPAPAAVPVYTEQEAATLTEYEKNWPDVAQAETIRRRGEYSQLLSYVFSEVAKYMQPVMADVTNLRNGAHIDQLKGAVPDYSDALESEVASWVEKQPAYLQTAYTAVMQGGTSDEVADLIGRYRAATGAAPAAAAPAGGPVVAPVVPAPKRETELSKAAKQAAASLAPVGSERSNVTTGAETGDFDSAFARFAAEAGT